MARQVPCNRTFARPSRPINGNDDISLGFGIFVRAHPRFFVPRLVRLSKKRLAPAAVARPVAVSVGRLLRAAVGRTSLRVAAGFALPAVGRLLHPAAAAGFAGR